MGKREAQLLLPSRPEKTGLSPFVAVHQAMTDARLDSATPMHPFYGTYRGHDVRVLSLMLRDLMRNGRRPVVWLAGDSSLDNKHWVQPQTPTTFAPRNGWEDVLHKAYGVVPDVAFWTNAHLERLGSRDPLQRPVYVNCAVEESTLGLRADTLLPQDLFAAEHMRRGDVVVVSVGGNDVVLGLCVSGKHP